MSLCRVLGESTTLCICRASLSCPSPLLSCPSPLRTAAWSGIANPLSTWRAASRLQLQSPASQRRCASSSAATEPLEGAPDLAGAAAAAAAAAAGEPSQQQQNHHHQQQQQQQQHHGAIEIVVGPMFAGKTTELLRRVQRYEAAGLSVAVVKSSKDGRYSAAHVVTHDGLTRCSRSVGGV